LNTTKTNNTITKQSKLKDHNVGRCTTWWPTKRQKFC